MWQKHFLSECTDFSLLQIRLIVYSIVSTKKLYIQTVNARLWSVDIISSHWKLNKLRIKYQLYQKSRNINEAIRTKCMHLSQPDFQSLQGRYNFIIYTSNTLDGSPANPTPHGRKTKLKRTLANPTDTTEKLWYLVPVFIDIKFIFLGTLIFKDKMCTEWKREYDVDNILENNMDALLSRIIYVQCREPSDMFIV